MERISVYNAYQCFRCKKSNEKRKPYELFISWFSSVVKNFCIVKNDHFTQSYSQPPLKYTWCTGSLSKVSNTIQLLLSRRVWAVKSRINEKFRKSRVINLCWPMNGHFFRNPPRIFYYIQNYIAVSFVLHIIVCISMVRILEKVKIYK